MPVAGGQSLLVMLRNKLIAPKALIDLEGLDELRGIRGAVLSDEAILEAGEVAAAEAEPITDAHATVDYRRKMVSVFVRRAIVGALEQMERDRDDKT